MRLRTVLLLPLAIALLLLGAPMAGAFATPAPYPPSACPTLSVSTTNPLPGESITVSGRNFDANARIEIVLDKPGRVMRTVTSDSNGQFTTSITLPAGLTGRHLFKAIGGGSDATRGCPADPGQAFDVQGGSAASLEPGSSGANGPGAPGSNGGGTAFTGLDVAGLLAIAAALIGAGALLNRRSRAGKASRAA
jgi:hypothetical protein